VPGLDALNKARNAGVVSVSCVSARNCAVGGYYADSFSMSGNPPNEQGFVAGEKNGRWGNPIEMPRSRA
jgi:hypothetical protein